MKSKIKTLIVASFSLVSIVIFLSSCEKEKLERPDENKVEDIAFDPSTTNYLLSKVTDQDGNYIEYQYDDEFKLIKFQWGDYEGDNNYRNFIYTYDDKLQEYSTYDIDGNIYDYDTFEWIYGDLVHIDYNYDYDNFKLVKNYQEIYEFNSIGYAKKITSTLYDEFENLSEYNDYYLIEWNNENVIKIENWDNYTSSNKNNILQKKDNLSDVKNNYRKTILNKFKNTIDYSLYSTRIYEYDNKKNPYRVNTINKEGWPTYYAKNNRTDYYYSNINNFSVTESYSLTYNQNDYPVSQNIYYESNDNGTSEYNSYSDYFEYYKKN